MPVLLISTYKMQFKLIEEISSTAITSISQLSDFLSSFGHAIHLCACLHKHEKKCWAETEKLKTELKSRINFQYRMHSLYRFWTKPNSKAGSVLKIDHRYVANPFSQGSSTNDPFCPQTTLSSPSWWPARQKAKGNHPPQTYVYVLNGWA